jgi:aspartyl/asparaginyl-tRNA synthetase
MFRARVSTSRGKGKFVFFNFRQRDASVQGILALTPERVSKQMIKWATALADESIVRVEGIVTASPEPIKSATISDVEIQISKVGFAQHLLIFIL